MILKKAFNSGKSLSGQLSYIKGQLSGLRQFLAIESPLKMIKNAFYFTFKALFVLKITFFCLDFLLKVLFMFFLLYVKWGPSQHIETISSRPLAFTLYKALETILHATFSRWFLKENIPLVMFIIWRNFIVWVPLLREILGIMCIVIVC